MFDEPIGVAADGAGALYVADSPNRPSAGSRSRPATVSTLAGTADRRAAPTPTGAAARFNTPAEPRLRGGTLYIADLNNHTLAQLVVATGAVTTLAGTAGAKGTIDGTGAARALQQSRRARARRRRQPLRRRQSNHTIRQIVLATAP